MTFNEVRKDYLVDRWVVIATSRSRRPTDFAKTRTEQAKTITCPMCPGNEHLTPPAVLVYLKSAKGIRKAKDRDGVRHKNWLIRCVPNLFPAFTPPQAKVSQKLVAKSGDLAPAVGHHEVIVESPVHEEHIADTRIPQLTLVINAYIDRLRELSRKPYVRYVSIFRNHGLEAGASLSHAHSQIIATPTVPTTVKEELKASEKHWKSSKTCVFCDIIKKERRGPRLAFENKSFVAFAPYASVHPMEFWIAPKKHQSTLLSLSKKDIEALAEAMKACLSGLKKLVNDPPYNYGFHIAPNKDVGKHFHWHLEVYPKLAIWAGFEKSTGMYINTVTPETAAESLKKAVSS
jgi:UDPglucose--hexose-1-phosphate uridylyltransferase